MTTEDAAQAESKKESVLFVDDEQHILSSIRRLMRPLKLNTYFANGGAEGLKVLEEHHIDLVVSDMRMPEMDGAEFLTKVKERWPDTVRMLLTGYADISSTIEALNNGGIYRYISKPWDDDELKEIVLEGLKLKRLEREKEELVSLTRKQNEELQDLNKNLEAKVEARTEEIRQTSMMLDVAYEELKDSYDSFVQVFSSFINAREILKKAESKRVAQLAKRMAKALKLKEESVQAVYYASLLHQMGKVGLPDRILSIPEQELTAEDAASYRQYPLIGETAISAISGFERTAALIRSHAEYYDGTGYPDGLSGNKTRSGARIIRAVHDFIGLQTGLVQREKLTADAAFAYIESQANKKYDPIVVKCLNHFRKHYDLSSLYSDEIKIESYALSPGMILTRDLFNSNGLLLISEGHALSAPMIEKILGLEKLEKAKFDIFIKVQKDEDQDNDEEEGTP